MTQNVTLNILGDTFIDLPYTDQVIENKSYLGKTRAGIFTVQLLTMIAMVKPKHEREAVVEESKNNMFEL